MFCGRCGAQQRPGARFCASCGAPMPVTQAPQPAAPASQRCESCGAMMRQTGPMHFTCDYCGSTFVVQPQPVQPVQPYPPQPYQPPAQPQKSAEEDLLDSIYEAAKRLFK